LVTLGHEARERNTFFSSRASLFTLLDEIPAASVQDATWWVLMGKVNSSGGAGGAMGKSVLVVEDEVGVRRALARLLAESGFRTIEAGNGREAIECLAKETPAAIVIDLLMPVMSGAELVKALRRNAFYRRIPTIVMTGAIDESVSNMGEALGIPVVFKPNIEQVPVKRLVGESEARGAASLPSAGRLEAGAETAR
jgi:CheY-like chemotaxis protein